MFAEELFCIPKAPIIPASNLVYKSRKCTDFETSYSTPLSASSRDLTSWKIVSRQDGSGFNTRCPFAAGQEQSLGSTKQNRVEGGTLSIVKARIPFFWTGPRSEAHHSWEERGIETGENRIVDSLLAESDFALHRLNIL